MKRISDMELVKRKMKLKDYPMYNRHLIKHFFEAKICTSLMIPAEWLELDVIGAFRAEDFAGVVKKVIVVANFEDVKPYL